MRWAIARMLRVGLVAASLTLGAAAMVRAQQAPESLLPPGFERPHPDHPTPRPRKTPQPAHPASPASVDHPPARALPTPSPRPPREAPRGAALARPALPASPTPSGGSGAVPAPLASTALPGLPALPGRITSFAQLLALPPDQIDALLGLKPTSDIPPAARHALAHIGVIDSQEGGFAPYALGLQDGALVRATLAGNHGALVSRWGHILLRRALASRLDAPVGMAPTEFVALRAALLLRMGEGDAARALLQDVDPDAYTPDLVRVALDAYVTTEDLTGLCPILRFAGNRDDDPRLPVMRAICAVFNGDANAGFHELDRLTRAGTMPHLDLLLAQKYAGAAGAAASGGHRAVTIEWDEVRDMTPWRFSLALGVGLDPPAALIGGDAARYAATAALAPALGLGARADASDIAGGAGVLSAAAMVDLYSQIYADDGVTGGPAERALALHDAYLADTPTARLAAMQRLWEGATGPEARYGRQVLTAYAAARLPANAALAGSAGELIAAMLAAGLDANALRWAGVVEVGSQGWALIALAAPDGGEVSASGLSAYQAQDSSPGNRQAAFLLAGLAGLGRVSEATKASFAARLGVDLAGDSHWSRTIDQAAMVGNPALVALLAGLGMQGQSWAQMTPRQLYHIVAALHRVGLSAEARMIAAEAAARGG